MVQLLTTDDRRLTTVLIANRGEIAVRVIRACRDVGISPVAIYSDVDASALHVRMADAAYCVGAAAPMESYLHIDRILEIAHKAQVDAIHPGYGFLAENAIFAERVIAAGLVWVGPSPSVIRSLGSKVAARQLALAVNVPVVPGTREPLSDVASAAIAARDIGYPVLLKASAGGGGKGMRVVHNETELARAFALATGEAHAAFGNGELFLEKCLISPHHVEIQILADAHGNVVHLGERECSIQRRHQKIIEETPSPFIHESTRNAMCDAAVRLVRHAGYVSAGTVEFLVDQTQQFYFLEVNTRLQVEHPITELVTGIDLVAQQLRIAQNLPLDFLQSDVSARGHAIECRLCAEEPAQNFIPSPGTIECFVAPHGPGVRVDSGVASGFTIPMAYDSLLAKICTWGATRNEAIVRMRRALQELCIAGVTTNHALLANILHESDFARGVYGTDYLAQHPSMSAAEPTPMEIFCLAAIARVLQSAPHVASSATTTAWQQSARQEGVGRGLGS